MLFRSVPSHDREVVSMAERPSAFHQFDYTSKTWVDPRTLADYQEKKWSEIKKDRDTAEYGGVNFLGKMFDSDATSQLKINGAVNINEFIDLSKSEKLLPSMFTPL